MKATKQTIKTNKFFRTHEGSGIKIDEDARTVDLAFSSESPVERFFGTEILDHSPESMRLGRLRNFGNVLVNHDPGDVVGVVEKVELGGDRVARALVRFGKSDRAEEIYQDVKDGIRKGVSVGYTIQRMKEDKEGTDEAPPVFRAIDWEPHEISIVSIPADIAVGVGRSDDCEIQTEILHKERVKKMTEEVKEAETAVVDEPVKVDVGAVREGARAEELKRIREIEAYGRQFGRKELADKYINEGTPVDAFRQALLEEIESKPRIQPSAELGLNEKEKQRYDLFKAISAAASGDWSKAGFEREVSQGISKTMGKTPKGFYIPTDFGWGGQRDMTVGTNTAGGFLKGTDHLADEFVDALRPNMVIASMGARVLSGLVGDVNIPAMNAKTTAYWVAENNAPTEGAPTVRQISMSPKTVGAYVDISRRLLAQSAPSAQDIFRMDMVQQIASEIDDVAIEGGGSNEPTGVTQTAGIGSEAIGTNGGAITWDAVVNLEGDVATANAAVGNLSYLTTPAVVSQMKRTVRVASTDSVFIMNNNEDLNGYKVFRSTNVPSDLTKGTLSGTAHAMLFGNWNDLVIGEWGGLDIQVDPYSLSTTGAVRVIVFKDVDVAVRNAASFSAILDIDETA